MFTYLFSEKEKRLRDHVNCISYPEKFVTWLSCSWSYWIMISILMHFQVNKDRRWDEIASSLKLDGRNLNYPDILLKLYALFLFQYEQIYFYRGPEKVASMPG